MVFSAQMLSIFRLYCSLCCSNLHRCHCWHHFCYSSKCWRLLGIHSNSLRKCLRKTKWDWILNLLSRLCVWKNWSVQRCIQQNIFWACFYQTNLIKMRAICFAAHLAKYFVFNIINNLFLDWKIYLIAAYLCHTLFLLQYILHTGCTKNTLPTLPLFPLQFQLQIPDQYRKFLPTWFFTTSKLDTFRKVYYFFQPMKKLKIGA